MSFACSKTYEDVADESDKYWNLQRYELIEEYADTPPAAPPLLIVWNFAILLRAITRRFLKVDCFTFLDLSGTPTERTRLYYTFCTCIQV